MTFKCLGRSVRLEFLCLKRPSFASDTQVGSNRCLTLPPGPIQGAGIGTAGATTTPSETGTACLHFSDISWMAKFTASENGSRGVALLGSDGVAELQSFVHRKTSLHGFGSRAHRVRKSFRRIEWRSRRDSNPRYGFSTV
jgi:hypothetical protein